MTSAFRKNSIVVATCMKRIHGLKKHAREEASISILAVKYTLAELVAVFQRSLDTRAEVRRLENQLAAARKERDAAEELRRAVDRQLGHWAYHHFGHASVAYRELGYAPPKTAYKSIETKVVAAKTARATRAARHTMGRRAKLAIKGKLDA